MQSLMGLVGVVSLILVAVIFSSNRKAINLRTVGGAFLLQAAIPALEPGMSARDTGDY